MVSHRKGTTYFDVKAWWGPQQIRKPHAVATMFLPNGHTAKGKK